MKLSQLAETGLELSPEAADLEITGLTADSRAVKQGYLFAALPGTNVDGTRFIPQAAEKGAVAVLVQKGAAVADNQSLFKIEDDDPRRQLALMAAKFFSPQPQQVVAVTGTNGKTSVASFVRQIWSKLGLKAASLGTVGIAVQEGANEPAIKPLSHTTPEPVELQHHLSDMADDGVTHLALEASSHGLQQRRLDGVDLKAAAFTNITQDHLDYHDSFDDYFAQKLRLFRLLAEKSPGATVVIDADTEAAPRVIDEVKAHGLIPFTIGKQGTSIRLLQVDRTGFSQHLTLNHNGDRHHVNLPLAGDFQVSNALVAAGLTIATGLEPVKVFKALSDLKGASGRLEHVGTTPTGAPIFVDYAHTPDAIATALEALRPYAQNRLHIVFGCGGDRDKDKRQKMGAAANKGADCIYVCDDNPRSEDPAEIRAEILKGAPGAQEIGDRYQAIKQAIGELKSGDLLVVAGKGHETGQIVRDKVIPFSDHQVIANILKDLTEIGEPKGGDR